MSGTDAASDPKKAAPFAGWRPADSAIVVLLAGAAALIRVAFYTGFFGSDEVTYTHEALRLLHGDWRVSDYIGSIRYGINLPVAALMGLFGVSEGAANLWSLACSVLEVVLVYLIGWVAWGRRAALLAAMVIGLLPLHVHFGGRLLADAPLSMLLTLTLLMFLIAERQARAGWYFATGLAAGLVFWVKEVVLLFWGAFGLYALATRRWRWNWLWIGVGIGIVVAASGLFMWLLAGDPMHVVKVIRTGVRNIVGWTYIDTSPWVYFRYLFVEVVHTWMLGYLALAGLVAAFALRARGSTEEREATWLIAVWALSLVAIFSFMVISLNPFRMISKQTNYMLIFAAPLCLLAGYFLSILRARWLAPLSILYAAGALMLAGLEQQVIRVFTANSWAAVSYATNAAGLPVYGMTNAHRAAIFDLVLRGQPDGKPAIRSMEELATWSRERPPGRDGAGKDAVALAIVDLQTATWGSNPITKLSEVPACWRQMDELKPTRDYGLGRHVVVAMSETLKVLPAALRDRLGPKVHALLRPRPAYVYAIPADCSFSLDRKPAQ